MIMIMKYFVVYVVNNVYNNSNTILVKLKQDLYFQFASIIPLCFCSITIIPSQLVQVLDNNRSNYFCVT